MPVIAVVAVVVSSLPLNKTIDYFQLFGTTIYNLIYQLYNGKFLVNMLHTTFLLLLRKIECADIGTMRKIVFVFDVD